MISLFLASLIFPHAIAQGFAPVTKPAVQAPQVTTPKAPTVANPGGASPSLAPAPAPMAAGQKAALIVAAYDEAAYKTAAATGGAVLLIFSGAGDTIWTQQSLVLQPILRESEFARLPAFQIDMSSAAADLHFGVTNPGTLVLMKGGFERLRSTRMVKADVIRKMLRLQSVL